MEPTERLASLIEAHKKNLDDGETFKRKLIEKSTGEYQSAVTAQIRELTTTHNGDRDLMHAQAVAEFYEIADNLQEQVGSLAGVISATSINQLKGKKDVLQRLDKNFSEHYGNYHQVLLQAVQDHNDAVLDRVTAFTAENADMLE